MVRKGGLEPPDALSTLYQINALTTTNTHEIPHVAANRPEIVQGNEATKWLNKYSAGS
jgi:hypothetical protein